MNWNKVVCGVGNNGVIFELENDYFLIVSTKEGRANVIPYWYNLAKYDAVCSPDQIDKDVLKKAKDIADAYDKDVDYDAMEKSLEDMRKSGAYDEFMVAQKQLVKESEKKQQRLYLD